VQAWLVGHHGLECLDNHALVHWDSPRRASPCVQLRKASACPFMFFVFFASELFMYIIKIEYTTTGRVEGPRMSIGASRYLVFLIS
jgi:hypothetical protein